MESSSLLVSFFVLFLPYSGSFCSLPYAASELFAPTCESVLVSKMSSFLKSVTKCSTRWCHSLDCASPTWILRQAVAKSTCVSTLSFTVIDTLSLFPCSCGQEEPTYSALWGDNKAFDEVIISPAMLNEHMPHMVMEGLNKVCFYLCVHADGFGGGVFEMLVK